VVLDSGIGLAWRHVHLSPPEAQALGLKDGDETDVEVEGERSIVFRKVWIRVHESFLSEFHVDVDEANACGLKTGDLVRLCL
jgi:putative phosphotransacetylase